MTGKKARHSELSQAKSPHANRVVASLTRRRVVQHDITFVILNFLVKNPHAIRVAASLTRRRVAQHDRYHFYKQKCCHDVLLTSHLKINS